MSPEEENAKDDDYRNKDDATEADQNGNTQKSDDVDADVGDTKNARKDGHRSKQTTKVESDKDEHSSSDDNVSYN